MVRLIRSVSIVGWPLIALARLYSCHIFHTYRTISKSLYIFHKFLKEGLREVERGGGGRFKTTA